MNAARPQIFELRAVGGTASRGVVGIGLRVLVASVDGEDAGSWRGVSIARRVSFAIEASER